MKSNPVSRTGHCRWIVILAVSLLGLTAGVAGASTAQEEEQGSQVLSEFESGKVQCSDASGEDFESVGEYVMGRTLGSARSHEAMNEVISRMMGSGNEPRVHEAMGRRYAGCGGGQIPAGFGRMMGALNAMGTMGDGMMGGVGTGEDYGSSGSMMGGSRSEFGASDDNFDGPSAAAMIGMMAILIGAVGVALLLLSQRRPHGPLDTLKQRYAAGELTNEEYEERRRLLGGS